MITPSQIRAARALLNLKQVDLATAADVSLATLNNIERGVTDPRASTLEAIQRALEGRGCIFIPENGEGPGVRLKKRVAAPSFTYSNPPYAGTSYTPARIVEMIARLGMRPVSQRGGPQADLVIMDPATGSASLLIELKHSGRMHTVNYDAVLETLLRERFQSLESVQDDPIRVFAGKLGDALVLRPEGSSTGKTAALLSGLVAEPDIQALRLFANPVERKAGRQHARGIVADRTIGGLALGAHELVLVDRPPLVMGRRPRVLEVQDVVDAAMASGKPVEVAITPLPTDTAELPPDEALRLIGSVQYEPLVGIHQLERLAA